MPFHAPAPGAVRAGRAEHRDEIFHGNALHPAPLRRVASARVLDCPQHVLKLHDGGGGEVSLLAQTGFQEIVRGLALRLAHGSHREAVAGKHLRRHESPMLALVRLERERGQLFLVRRQRGEKFRGGIRHRGRRAVGGTDGAEPCHDADKPQKNSRRAGSAHRRILSQGTDVS